MKRSPRLIEAVIPGSPYGWRAPKFEVRVLGYRPAPKRAKPRNCSACLRPWPKYLSAKVPNTRVHTYPVAEMEAFQQKAIPILRAAAMKAAVELGLSFNDIPGVLSGPVSLRVLAVFARPKSHHRKTRGRPREPKETKPDATNVLKLVEDCATQAGWWRDDAQVATVTAGTRWAAIEPHECQVGRPCSAGGEEYVRVRAWEELE